jgi:heptaprenyl diphosphate synthase
VAALSALAIAIHVAESTLPAPIAGIKPGLANVVTLVALGLYGWRCAAWVSLLRVLAGSLFVGSFLSPTFMLALSGALSSLAVLGLVQRIPGVGPVGQSLLAAQAHMIGQFAAAYWLFVPHPAMLRLLPILLSAALAFGLMSGMIAQLVLQRIGPR